MFEHEKLSIEFVDCEPLQKEILEKYWYPVNFNGDYEMPLSKIQKDYSLTPNQLYKLAREKSNVIWTFGKCECGSTIRAELTKRTDLISCLNNYGIINTYRSVEDFVKCEKCQSEDRDKELFLDWGPDDPFYENNDETFSPLRLNFEDSLGSKIKSLSPYEIKILSQLYELGDFNLIKHSSEIFPVKYGEQSRFVWRTIYKLD